MLVEHHKTNSVSNNQQIFLSDTDLRVSYMCAFNVIHIGPTQEFGDLSCEQCSLVGFFFLNFPIIRVFLAVYLIMVKTQV